MGKPTNPPLYLDLDADEALERFLQTDPKEVEELIEAGKKRKPPGTKAGTKAPGDSAGTERSDHSNRSEPKSS